MYVQTYHILFMSGIAHQLFARYYAALHIEDSHTSTSDTVTPETHTRYERVLGFV